MHTPLHMPKTLDVLKKACLVWLKKLQDVQQIARLKQQRVLSSTLYITHKDFLRKLYVFICYMIGSVVKIVLYLQFLYTKDDRLWQIKKKHGWWNNSFSDCNWTPTHNHLVHKQTLNDWVFIYELSGCGFESSYSHLNFRFRTCFEQGVPWHSGNYIVWIHSEMHTWHDKNIQSFFRCLYLLP